MTSDGIRFPQWVRRVPVNAYIRSSIECHVLCPALPAVVLQRGKLGPAYAPIRFLGGYHQVPMRSASCLDPQSLPGTSVTAVVLVV